MNEPDRQTPGLARDLKAVRSAASELAAQLRSASQAGRELARRAGSACAGGTCGAAGAGNPGGAGLAGGANSAGLALTRTLSSALGSLAGGLQSALRSMLAGLARTLAATVGRAAGGGIFGGLLGGLAGGGLAALISGLFQRKQRVSVDGAVRAEVLNFPRLLSLDYAVNPASRLLGGRAVARGPAFTVEVSYRGGAEDVVAAKVASRLRDLNLLQGAV